MSRLEHIASDGKSLKYLILDLQHFDVKVLFENADKRKRECDRERKSGVHVAEPFIRRTSGSERVRQDTFLI